MKLYSPLFGDVEFAEVMDTDYVPIRVMKRGLGIRFDEYGRYMGNEYPDSECLLFPSKDCRTWEGWKLPVQPKFKVHDWVVGNEGIFKITQYEDEHGYDITDTTGRVVHFVSPDYVESNFHLWTVRDAKDGDILVSGIDNPFIYNGNIEFSSAGAYIGISRDGKIRLDMFPSKSWTTIKDAKPATKEQRNLLFDKMKKIGYEWDEKKKELKKFPKHYDISNFHAGMPVLVRDDKTQKWDYNLFSRIDDDSEFKFVVCSDVNIQCIPFNDDTKHLLGTTGMPSEEYINW